MVLKEHRAIRSNKRAKTITTKRIPLLKMKTKEDTSKQQNAYTHSNQWTEFVLFQGNSGVTLNKYVCKPGKFRYKDD